MTAKVIRIPEVSADRAASEPDTEPRQETGWDPYEVWRTRVLEPRLNESAPEAAVTNRPGKLSVVKRLLRPRKK